MLFWQPPKVTEFWCYRSSTIDSRAHDVQLKWLPGKLMKKHPPFGEEKTVVASWQCTHSFICRCNSELGRFALRIGAASTLFSGFGSHWLLSPSQHKKMAGWEKFSSNERVIAETDGYFADLEVLLFGGLKKVGKSLGEVYRATIRLWRNR